MIGYLNQIIFFKQRRLPSFLDRKQLWFLINQNNHIGFDKMSMIIRFSHLDGERFEPKLVVTGQSKTKAKDQLVFRPTSE